MSAISFRVPITLKIRYKIPKHQQFNEIVKIEELKNLALD